MNRPISPVFMSDLLGDVYSRAVDDAAGALVPAEDEHGRKRKRKAVPTVTIYKCRLLWFDVPRAFLSISDVEAVEVQIATRSNKGKRKHARGADPDADAAAIEDVGDADGEDAWAHIANLCDNSESEREVLGEAQRCVEWVRALLFYIETAASASRARASRLTPARRPGRADTGAFFPSVVRFWFPDEMLLDPKPPK